ncbi:hypothetical protein EDD16DRAFT_1724218 [Pisolithus croceorrhizus]|nr:hypothetical protein EDD16DRAFT_1724218 [Pisolithus croceorrhizus]KAI6131697.1 hypothetical protein EV401DRAFT_2193612 [Pisolithus croceorrhizus]
MERRHRDVSSVRVLRTTGTEGQQNGVSSIVESPTSQDSGVKLQGWKAYSNAHSLRFTHHDWATKDKQTAHSTTQQPPVTATTEVRGEVKSSKAADRCKRNSTTWALTGNVSNDQWPSFFSDRLVTHARIRILHCRINRLVTNTAKQIRCKDMQIPFLILRVTEVIQQELSYSKVGHRKIWHAVVKRVDSTSVHWDPVIAKASTANCSQCQEAVTVRTSSYDPRGKQGKAAVEEVPLTWYCVLATIGGFYGSPGVCVKGDPVSARIAPGLLDVMSVAIAIVMK